MGGYARSHTVIELQQKAHRGRGDSSAIRGFTDLEI
jgi:hypothetical protein